MIGDPERVAGGMRTRLRSRGGGPVLFSTALDALGQDGMMGRRDAVVSLDQIVGTVAKPGDFDADFRLRNRAQRDRWHAAARLVATGQDAPVELLQLGEMYFVVDGHHRVSAARTLGRDSVAARVVRICTIAYAMACLRCAHLPSKAAERRFLERVPLPWEVRRTLWMEEPARWGRLADAAEAWAHRQMLSGRRLTDPEACAAAWWNEEVIPLLDRLRSAGVAVDLNDVQTYATALALRDEGGWLTWPDDLADQLA
jgi:hypothetical protein